MFVEIGVIGDTENVFHVHNDWNEQYPLFRYENNACIQWFKIDSIVWDRFEQRVLVIRLRR